MDSQHAALMDDAEKSDSIGKRASSWGWEGGSRGHRHVYSFLHQQDDIYNV